MDKETPTIDPKSILKQIFGFDEFLPFQEDVVRSVLDKRDTVAIMPTGGGKSLCFQLPALIFEGVTVVISPLIALMKDQVEGLKANGVAAVFMNSSQTRLEHETIREQVRKGEIKLLYISPEKVLTRDMQNFLHEFPVSLIAIDEAHCVSMWGHDFRPEYTQLRTLRAGFPDVPVIALTATADKLTRQDIVHQIQLKNPNVFISSFDRPNLHLRVLPGKGRMDRLLDFVQARREQAGIIYCLSKKSTERVAEKLRDCGINAEHYHAGMSAPERSAVQDSFIYGETPVICATIAFGMGIDKSNVRYVIHYNLPKNIEGYYQEIGRAGRDGLPSETLLFYSLADVISLREMLSESADAQVQLAKLERIGQYAEAAICRRKILLAYFGETKDENCGACDVCENPPDVFDGTVLAQKALSAIARLRESIASGTLIDILRGSKRQDIVANGFDKIPTFGVGKDISPPDWQQYILQMLHLGLIDIAYDRNYALTLTPNGKAVLLGQKKVSFIHVSDMEKRAAELAPVSRRERTADVIERRLFTVLSDERARLAKEENIAPHTLCSDATLKDMAEQRPTTENELKAIVGMGEEKRTRYGQYFLDRIIKEIAALLEDGIKVRGGTFLLTYVYYKNGMPIPDIAKKREIQEETVFSHLAQLYEEGYAIKSEDFVTKEEVERVAFALSKYQNEPRLTELFLSLNQEIDYGKIRFAMAVLKRKE